MELKDFIEQSVSDIAEAILTLKKKYNNPQVGKRYQVIAAEKESSLKHTSHAIDFDIAIATSETSNDKTGGKVGIKVLNASMEKEGNCTKENASRIKFSIPFYPEFIEHKD